jgi:hypothetical protein
MSEKIESKMISRRSVISLLGLTAALGFVVPGEVLTASDAEAQTTPTPTPTPAPAGTPAPPGGATGHERRKERRAARHERRKERRAARHERREKRRGGGETKPQ